MGFTLDIKKFAEKTNSNLGEASRAIKISLFNGIIRDTRVDKGRLRGNWQTSTGAPIETEIDRVDKVEQGIDGGSAMQEVLDNVEAVSKDYLTNNLPYAKVWDDEDGMVDKNMARINRNVQEAVNNVNS